MTQMYEWDDLAHYNSEVSRGLVHTAEMDARMAQRQAAFDAAQLAQYEREGWTPMRFDNGEIVAWVSPSKPRRAWRFWRRHRENAEGRVTA